ncbi:MAG: dihydroorotate dehydrogenase, partial [Lachnospiraceae bacterium]|nr:dihydroorotate dehydrogenase [Lachnospiraceae bacterium]
TVEEYLTVVERLNDQPIAMMEINVSCPNVKEGALAFGQDAKVLERVTAEIKKAAKKPVIMKLSPNVTNIKDMALAAEAGGADAISLINTLIGMKIDINRKTFALANKTGGFSGPAIKPVAVRMVYDAAHAVKIPVIGMGGIGSGEDAVEFLLAGATAVSVGTMNFVDPMTTIKVVDGIEAYMKKFGHKDIQEIIKAVK